MLLNINYSQYTLAKAFIGQAKICKCRGRYRLSNGNIKKNLIKQCEGMLKITPYSFVIVYTPNEYCGIVSYPAIDVYALGDKVSCAALSKLHGIKLKKLFELLLKCYIGDYRIASGFWGEERLMNFAREYSIRHSLLLSILGE